MKSKTLKRWLAAFVGLVVLGTLSAPTILAQDEGSGGSGIQIIPTRTELSVGAGELSDIVITLKNVTRSEIIAKGFLHDFEPNNVTGEPQLIVDPDIRTAFSLKDYVRNLQDHELKPGETKDITIQVSIPPDTAPGGYYGAIRYAAVPKNQVLSEEDRQVALTASVASLLLVEVPGDITESIRIDKIAAELNGREGNFFFSAPDKANIHISNTGNSFVKPFGIVTVKRGKTEVYSYQLNDVGQRGNVLPKSSRVFKNDIKNVSKFGRYVITANVSYTDGGEVITVSKTFWVIPLWLIILAVSLLLLIVLLIFYLQMKLRSRRHRARR